MVRIRCDLASERIRYIAFEAPEKSSQAVANFYREEIRDLVKGQCSGQNVLGYFAQFVYQLRIRHDDQPISFSNNFEQAVRPLPKQRIIQLFLPPTEGITTRPFSFRFLREPECFSRTVQWRLKIVKVRYSRLLEILWAVRKNWCSNCMTWVIWMDHTFHAVPA